VDEGGYVKYIVRVRGIEETVEVEADNAEEAQINAVDAYVTQSPTYETDIVYEEK
jgi:hypothetical protein